MIEARRIEYNQELRGRRCNDLSAPPATCSEKNHSAAGWMAPWSRRLSTRPDWRCGRRSEKYLQRAPTVVGSLVGDGLSSLSEFLGAGFY